MGRRKKGGVAAAVGLLCAVAATVAVWSGPLASATAGFHASTGTAPVVAHAAPAAGHSIR
jgi:ferric-dicitrate binding protein FerR (iron transport regulator)